MSIRTTQAGEDPTQRALMTMVDEIFVVLARKPVDIVETALSIVVTAHIVSTIPPHQREAAVAAMSRGVRDMLSRPEVVAWIEANTLNPTSIH